jgi:hypothetical protein
MEEGMKWYSILAFSVPILVTLKALLIGSEFDFVEWARHGRHYLNWYSNLREPETYIEYRVREAAHDR